MSADLLRTHEHIPDHGAGPDHRGDYPCLTCGLPKRNRAHDPEAVAAQAARHQEYQRRYGTND